MADNQDVDPVVAAFLRGHPDLRWIDAMIPDMCGIPRGKRLDASAVGKLFTTGIVLPGSTYAMDMLGNNVDSTGMGTVDGIPTFLSRRPSKRWRKCPGWAPPMPRSCFR